jgi:hypothetical protein
MADHTDNAIRAAIKAVRDVVAPSVDPTDPLANEQVRLVGDFLEFLQDRIDYVHDRQRFEVGHYVALADSLSAEAAACSPDVASRLQAAAKSARELLDRTDARSAELKAAAAHVAGAVRDLIRAADAADAETRRRVHRTVIAASKALLDLQRAWFLPQGFEPDPLALPTLESALVTP